MRGTAMLLIAVAMGFGAAGAAPAREHNGAEAIARSDYGAAEREIERGRRLFPNDADLLLNLATVYRATGRADAARTLYAQVLTGPNESVLMPASGSVSAHAVARAGLARMQPVAYSAR